MGRNIFDGGQGARTSRSPGLVDGYDGVAALTDGRLAKISRLEHFSPTLKHIEKRHNGCSTIADEVD
jgi:hypothetical protein